MGDTCRNCVFQLRASHPSEKPAFVCLFTAGRKVSTSAVCFLPNVLLGACFIFLIFPSAFSGSIFTPQPCEHNLLPPGESCLMLHIPLG